MQKVKIRVEKRYVISVGNIELPGRFIEVSEMAGMKLFKDEKGKQIVLDFPPDSAMEELLASVLDNKEEIEANVVKASLDLFAELKKSVKKETDNGRAVAEDTGRNEGAVQDGNADESSKHTVDSGMSGIPRKSVQGTASVPITTGSTGSVLSRGRRPQTEGGSTSEGN